MAVESFFWWTEEQKELSNRLEKFVESNIELADKTYWAKEYPHEIMNQISQLGLMGVAVPKEYGGIGLGSTGCCIVAEQLGRLPGVGNLFVISMLAGLHQLLKFGAKEQKERWLPQIAAGKTLGTICITEPFAGSDASNINTTAELVDGHWVINGKKRMISAAGIATRYLVYARTKKDDSDLEYTNITAFMIEKGTPGFHVEKINSLIGYDNIPNGYLDFEDVVVPDENRIGGIGSGWEVMMSGLNFERLIAAAVVSGSMIDTIKFLLHYTDRRVQFKQKISMFSNIQMDIADFIAKSNMVRLYTFYTAAELDKNIKIRMDKSSIAKLYSTEWASALGLKGIQIMGGDGLTKFYPVERTLRESKIGEIVAGTNEVQKLIVYRTAMANRKNYKYPYRIVMDPEMNIPVQSAKESQFRDIEINAENILKVLADDYRCNPGLCMTINDLMACTNGKKAAIIQAVKELDEMQLVYVYKSEKGAASMVKANYEGLRKAFPREYYQWFPKGYDGDKLF